MTIETESKFPVREFSLVASNLQILGTCIAPWYFEQNQVFDFPGNDLRSQGVLLRLRKAGVITLTLKRPLEDHAGIPGIKQLEELECHVDDAHAMASILRALGYREMLGYEKFRSKWKIRACTVCLDRLCFGSFVEIEGTGSDIFETAAELGLDPQTALSANYHHLFQEHLTRKGLPPDDTFVFSDQERASLCLELGIERP